MTIDASDASDASGTIGTIDAVGGFRYDLHHAHGEDVMSGGRPATSQIGTAVRLRMTSGLAGWGEVTPLGNRYLPTHLAEVRGARGHPPLT
ncbi:MAG: hypothetical protein M3171_03185, partial [Actinomycetota bacterium]|nr:hypothetical protein [Actinomycetota bacterium]